MPADEILLAAEGKMQKSEELVINEFSGIRTGKASPALIENVLVEAYGRQMRIKELAGITAPEARTLLIQPWDIGTISLIDKAIQKANLGLNPMVDNKCLRIILPELSEERRIEFTKVVRKMAEEGRVAVRHVRRDAIDHLKKEAKDGTITEDEQAVGEKEVQKLTDKYVAKIDDHMKKKETEIMTV
ncbi:MAG: Ribosome-recycling factor [Verrucomicrobia subdivision 3 bacterium]|nr:Ribosome-recycling factor [Limisphaerales bacterium]MCS1417765.1 Ribosome-recycling factor [Limisphaerales bacterium]